MSTTKRRLARTCRAEVIADAPVEAVWRVVADVTRTGEWSHECLHVRAGGAGAGRYRDPDRPDLTGDLRRIAAVAAADVPAIAWRHGS
jgi:uncharacterized protein YndB with AHSA1/START domain